MGGNDGLFRIHHRVIGSLGATVGHINEHAHLVHPLHAPLAEHGQATVIELLAAVAQSIAFRVGDAQLADTQAI